MQSKLEVKDGDVNEGERESFNFSSFSLSPNLLPPREKSRLKGVFRYKFSHKEIEDVYFCVSNGCVYLWPWLVISQTLARPSVRPCRDETLRLR